MTSRTVLIALALALQLAPSTASAGGTAHCILVIDVISAKPWTVLDTEFAGRVVNARAQRAYRGVSCPEVGDVVNVDLTLPILFVDEGDQLMFKYIYSPGDFKTPEQETWSPSASSRIACSAAPGPAPVGAPLVVLTLFGLVCARRRFTTSVD